MENEEKEDRFALFCPKCGRLTFFIKFFKNKIGYYCNQCSYWEDCK